MTFTPFETAGFACARRKLGMPGLHSASGLHLITGKYLSDPGTDDIDDLNEYWNCSAI